MEGLSPLLESGLGGVGRLSSAEASLRAASFWDGGPMRAAAVLLPRTTEEVARCLAACYAAGQPVVVQGGRTGCVGGGVTHAGQVGLSLEKLDQIEEIDPVQHVAVVQAGVVLQTLQERAREHGLFLPLDLGARGSCTMGGVISTNAGGVSVIRHGMMRNLVLGLEAVLPDGRVVSSMKRMLKDNSGYDLKQLFIGTEGTLGVVTRAVVRLEPAPGRRCTALVALARFDRAAALLTRCKARLGPALTSFELMWGDYVRAVCAGHGLRAPVGLAHGFYAVLEVEASPGQDSHPGFISLLEEALEEGLLEDGALAQSEAERALFWRIRDDFEPILRNPPVFLFDVSLPLAAMEGYLEGLRAALAALAPGGVLHVFGHVGDGNLHLFVAPGQGREGLKSQIEACVYEPLRALGGSISAEHGIGREKKAWLQVSRSPAEIALMQTLKRALDPKNLLNPGVVFDL